ncbi:MAG: thioredoxin family protein [Planctomycetota bacterium]|nr:thioredoxin family protein [Planctomycetota bacterium]
MSSTPFGGRRAAGFALLALLALCLPAPVAWAEDEPAGDAAPAGEAAEVPWVRDYAEAKALAKKEGKDLLINFTGSDWCVYCLRLEEEVFTHAGFVDPMSKKYVFVFMDSPRDATLEKEVVDPKLRDQLLQDMLVGGFPTLILATADGTPYARTGYQKGGWAPFLKHMAELDADGEKVKKLLAQAESDDTTTLKEGVQTLAKHMLLGYPGYAALLGVAEKADADGSLGLKPLVEAERARKLAVAEQKALAAVLPQNADEEFDWEKIGAALLETKHMTGLDFMRLVFACTNYMLEEKEDGAKAKALLELAKRDPMLEDHARAKEIWAEMLARAEDLLAGGPDKDAPEGDGGK